MLDYESIVETLKKNNQVVTVLLPAPFLPKKTAGTPFEHRGIVNGF